MLPSKHGATSCTGITYMEHSCTQWNIGTAHSVGNTRYSDKDTALHITCKHGFEQHRGFPAVADGQHSGRCFAQIMVCITRASSPVPVQNPPNLLWSRNKRYRELFSQAKVAGLNCFPESFLLSIHTGSFCQTSDRMVHKAKNMLGILFFSFLFDPLPFLCDSGVVCLFFAFREKDPGAPSPPR